MSLRLHATAYSPGLSCLGRRRESGAALLFLMRLETFLVTALQIHLPLPPPGQSDQHPRMASSTEELARGLDFKLKDMLGVELDLGLRREETFRSQGKKWETLLFQDFPERRHGGGMSTGARCVVGRPEG